MPLDLAASLASLPAGGAFTSARLGARGPLQPYLATHDTAPPPGQLIRTNPENLLVRALAKKAEREKKKAAEAKKREAESAPAAPPAKRATPLAREDVARLSVAELKAELRERKLVVGGVKDVLVERLLVALAKEPGPA